MKNKKPNWAAPLNDCGGVAGVGDNGEGLEPAKNWAEKNNIKKCHSCRKFKRILGANTCEDCLLKMPF